MEAAGTCLRSSARHVMASLTIGLTGPIGSGKSTIAQILANLGARVLDADALTRQLQKPGELGYQRIVELFGPTILDEAGEINRRILADTVFRDAGKLSELERALHPLIEEHVLTTKKVLLHNEVLVVEGTKLIESRIRSAYDEIWVVIAPTASILMRLRGRGMSDRESSLRLANQASREAFRSAATIVIENDGGLVDIRERIEREWARIHHED
jgi:dephospho-CoA kinase